MQRGCLKPNSRKRGPDAWQFHWSETISESMAGTMGLEPAASAVTEKR
jgi:hypothetical protein